MVNRQARRRGFEHRWCRKAWASSAPPSANTEGQPRDANTEGQPRDQVRGRAIRVAWKAIGWFATADRDRRLPPVRRVQPAQGAGAASKTDGTIGLRFEFSALRQILSTTDVLATRE